MRKSQLIRVITFFFMITLLTITNSAQTGELIVTAPGDYQRQLGCEPQTFDGNWEPACELTQLTDPDGDDIYTWSSTEIGIGDWEMKIAIDYSWDENYGDNGVQNGDNIPFSVEETGQEVTFSYDANTHQLSITVGNDENNDSVSDISTIHITENNRSNLPAVFINPNASRSITPTALNGFNLLSPVLDATGQLIITSNDEGTQFVEVAFISENDSEERFEGYMPLITFNNFVQYQPYGIPTIAITESNRSTLPSVYVNQNASRSITPTALNGFDLLLPALDATGQLVITINDDGTQFVAIVLVSEDDSEEPLEGYIQLIIFSDFAQENEFDVAVQAQNEIINEPLPEQEVSLPVPVGEIASLVEITTRNVAQLEERLPLSRGTISSVAHSPIDNTLAVASATGLYLFDSSDLSADPVHIGDSYNVIDNIVYSPDGTKIAYTSVEGIHIYNLETGRVRQLSGTSNSPFVIYMDFDQIGENLIAGVSVRLNRVSRFQIITWDASSGQQLNIIDNEDMGGASTVIYGNRAIFTRFGNIEIWNIETEELITRIENRYDDFVFDIDYAPNTELVVTEQSVGNSSVNRSSVVQLWNTNTGELITEIIGENENQRIDTVQFTPDELGILIIDYTNNGLRFRIWNIESQQFEDSFYGNTFGSFEYINNQSGILSNSIGELSIVEFVDDSIEVVDTVQSFSERLGGTQFTHNGNSLVTAFNDGVRVWDVDTWDLTLFIDEGTSSYNGQGNRIDISPDDQYIARTVQSPDGEDILFYDFGTGETIVSISYERGPIFSLDYHPSGDYIAAGRAGFDTAFYSTQSGALLTRYQEGGIPFNVVFSPDGTLLASGNADDNTRVLDVETRQYLYVIEHDNDVNSLAFSHDSTILATGGNRVRLWDAQTGRAIRMIDQHDVKAMAFSPDDSLLATLTPFYFAIWDVNSGRMLWGQEMGSGQDPSVDFHPDGNIISTTHENMLRLWMINTGADADSDGVDDIRDRCPTLAGDIEGCPDSDSDGIVDSSDSCPTEIGTVSGCPDDDEDGVGNSDDLCPQEIGSIAANGCPDEDNDGVVDSEDLCPSVAGVEQFEGCPDTDADNIADTDDSCPIYAGTLENDGCPFTGNTNTNANTRVSPSTNGTVVRSIPPSEEFYVIGRNSSGDWLQIVLTPDEDATIAWVFASLVVTDADISTIPVQE